MNILSIGIVAETSPEAYKVLARLADGVIRFQRIDSNDKNGWRVYMWRAGREPVVVTHELITECQSTLRQEVLKVLKSSKTA